MCLAHPASHSKHFVASDVVQHLGAANIRPVAGRSPLKFVRAVVDQLVPPGRRQAPVRAAAVDALAEDLMLNVSDPQAPMRSPPGRVERPTDLDADGARGAARDVAVGGHVDLGAGAAARGGVPPVRPQERAVPAGRDRDVGAAGRRVDPPDHRRRVLVAGEGARRQGRRVRHGGAGRAREPAREAEREGAGELHRGLVRAARKTLGGTRVADKGECGEATGLRE